MTMLLKKFLSRLILFVSSGFALITILSILASLFQWDKNAPFILLVYFPKLLFLAGTLFFLAVLLFLKKPAAIVLQCLSLCFLLSFLFMTVFSGSGRTPPGESWLLMSINTNKCRKDLALLAGAVNRHAPDFLCLQEVPRWVTKEKLDFYFPSFFWCKKKRLAVGAVFPLACRRSLSFEERNFGLAARCRLGEKSLLLASIHLKQPGNFSIGTLIDLIGPRRNFHHHMTSADHLDAWVREKKKPLLLIGDFNAPPESFVMRRFDLADAFSRAGSGLGLSWPSEFSIVSIDHCLHNRHITVYHCETISLSGFSDHRGLLVRWGFTPEPRTNQAER